MGVLLNFLRWQDVRWGKTLLKTLPAKWAPGGRFGREGQGSEVNSWQKALSSKARGWASLLLAYTVRNSTAQSQISDTMDKTKQWQGHGCHGILGKLRRHFWGP